jgi:hypothetical protein
VDEVVEEALGQTEGVQELVEKEVTVGLAVLVCEPVFVLEAVRVTEAVCEEVAVRGAVRLAVLEGEAVVVLVLVGVCVNVEVSVLR